MKNSAYRMPKSETGMETFNQILNAAKTLFATKGFSATSINEIISLSDVAIGTFYLYFDNKKALYHVLLEKYGNLIVRHIETAIRSLKERKERTSAGIKAFLQLVFDDLEYYRVVIELMYVDREYFKEYYANFINHYRRKQPDLNEPEVLIYLESLGYTVIGIANLISFDAIFENKISKEAIDSITNNLLVLIEKGEICKNGPAVE